MKNSLFLIVKAILVFLLVIGLVGSLVFIVLNRSNGVITSSGEKRAYLLHVPESYDPAAPAPLVISMHGFAEWPAHQMKLTRWNDLADEYGFLVVYPMGTQFPLRWRTHGESGSDWDPMLDVTFISDLIDKLSSDYNIDPARIYANGLSNGGGMSFVLSCELADRIAAIGSVSGAYSYAWDRCSPSRPVPAIIFHGTADGIVLYEGGSSNDVNLALPNIPEWVDELASRNGCDPEPQDLPEVGEVSGVRYTGCDADVDFYTIHGGGHSWPGGDALPEQIVGHTTMDVVATRIMWQFFMEHPKQ